ncbi:hypothetical protein [Bacillus phage phiAGATE]|uniref:DUF7349 domain-containing protein n=1 Tax=Bacillus phage phiAGATE TaxID=1204533 RepID=L0LBT1_9CAUD|nr:hypothetical protein G380_gp159 [Bacillus phage phiAGATE]AGB62605.1 hypothetical protein [Bacillus phage phiAGATE]
MTLINSRLAGLKVASSFGELSFNEKGECNDLKVEQEKAFDGLAGYIVVEEKTQNVKEDKKEEPKEEKKTKKSTSKKETNKK